MLGKSAGAQLLVLALVCGSCAHNVVGDAKSTADAKEKGAKEIKIDNGEGKAVGIVTYPGGDRTDWKMFEVPDKKRGKIEIKLTWNPPRPGLQLAFDVFDEWNTPVVGSKKMSKKKAKSSGKVRTATINDAKGKYFIRVYAVGRGDAGKYKLSLDFSEQVAGLKFDPLKLEIPDPPKLAAVPEIEVGCDEFTFDAKVPACKAVCPATGAPPGWPACKGKCPTPPTVDEPACWNTMPCPKGQPDERIKSCKPKDWPPCPDKNAPDDSNPNCRVKAAPQVARIISKEIRGGEMIVRVGIGTKQGVKKGWVGTVVRGNDVNERAVPGGEVVVKSVDVQITELSVKLTADQISATPWVRLQPP